MQKVQRVTIGEEIWLIFLALTLSIDMYYFVVVRYWFIGISACHFFEKPLQKFPHLSEQRHEPRCLLIIDDN